MIVMPRGRICFSADGEPFDIDASVWRFDNRGVRSNFNFDLLAAHVDADFLVAAKLTFADLVAGETAGTTKQRFAALLRVIYRLSEGAGGPISRINASDLEIYFEKGSVRYDYNLVALFRRWLDLKLGCLDPNVVDMVSDRPSVYEEADYVLTLHPTKGPYLDSEIIAADLALRNAFERGAITDEDFVFAMTFRLYGQRPVQVANLKLSDIRIAGENGCSRTEIRFPLAKKRGLHVSHGPSRPTPMLFSTVLESFVRARRAGLSAEEAALAPLFPPKSNAHPRIDPGYEGHNSGGTLSGRFSDIMDGLDIVSPRTSQKLVCNAQRERHTAATLLAMKGCSAEEIAAWMHHDSALSCESYVELGVRHHQLMHSILDGRFTHLAGRFFGEIIFDRDMDEFPPEALILDTEDHRAPIVGGCATGGCAALDELAAPFACLNGCPNLRLSLHADLRPLIERVAERKRDAKRRGDSEYHEALNRHLAQITAAENALRERRCTTNRAGATS